MMHTPELERIVDRQVALWDTKQRRGDENEQDREKRKERRGGPWVTVSMQLGSGGIELAQGVGEHLGWQVFNKEIVKAIAGKTHSRERILSRLDEHAVGTLHDYLSHLFVPDHLAQPSYLIEMVSVLWAIARQGQAVIVGRGANWLLDPHEGLRVRVIAPVDKRVEWVARKEGLPAPDARRRVQEDDVDRAAFIRKVYRQDIDEALGYDLVLNTGTLELAPAIETVVTALARKVPAAV